MTEKWGNAYEDSDLWWQQGGQGELRELLEAYGYDFEIREYGSGAELYIVIAAPFYLQYRKRTVELTSAALIKLHLDFKVLLDKL